MKKENIKLQGVKRTKKKKKKKRIAHAGTEDKT